MKKLRMIVEAPDLTYDIPKDYIGTEHDSIVKRDIGSDKPISTMESGHKVYRTKNGSEYGYHAVDPKTGKTHISVYVDPYRDGVMVNNLFKAKKSSVEPADFYDHILQHHKIYSDIVQSPGASKLWRNLSQKYGVKVGHIDLETGKPVKLHTKDWDKNYEADSDLETQFVASKK